MDFEAIKTFIFQKLEAELPAHLTYHNVQHTREVLKAASHISKEEKLTTEQTLLVKTAALFHDTGFIINHKNHEKFSCEIASEYLPSYGYTAQGIKAIQTMIMATKFLEVPKDHMSMVLCDADLYYLGGEDYQSKANNLYEEYLVHDIVKNNEDWIDRQIDFLNTHKFYTSTAIKEREAKKQIIKATLLAIQNHTSPTTKHISNKRLLSETIQLVIGALLAAFALKGFFVPNHFFDGGVTGVSLLTYEIYHFNLALVIVLFNLPFIIIGYFTVSRSFAIKTLVSVVLLGIFLLIIPKMDLTEDKLLVAVFGGVFLGIGSGMVMRLGAALDGIEVLALYAFKKTSFTITEIILAINVTIFTIAAFQFGVETALYSCLTYFVATRTIDYVIDGIQAYIGVTIISSKSEAIKLQIVHKMERAITVYKGERGFLPGPKFNNINCDILFTVITRLEMRRLKMLINDIDPEAFVFTHTIKDTSGGILSRIKDH